ncbi:MAG TPA: acyl carrier protein [Ktedonobacteraceae bacterium]|nr:acyl carrier protein [Ktedonobacteraceae bacterium]
MQAKVNNKLKDLIDKRLERDSAEILPQSRLSQDLGMSVVKFARLLKDIANVYRIDISKEEKKQIETVGDLQELIEKHRTR